MAEAAQVSEAPVEKKAAREKATLQEYLESLLVTVILALFGTSFIVQAFKIPSPSMERTLLVGDHLLVNKFIFGGRGAWYEKILPYRPVRHGDIIVFRFPFQDHPHFVKRVIGIPGDRIKIVDQQVYVNGKRLNEPYVVHDPGAAYDPFGGIFLPRANICCPARSSRSGPTKFTATSSATSWWSHRTSILRWVIIATTVWTVATGASLTATPLWAVRC